MPSTVYRRIPECDPTLVEQAGRFAVADLHESMDVITGRMALMDGSIRPLNPGLRIAGQAVTAYCFPGDGLLAHKAVSLVGPGQVLLFSNGGSGPQTMFAELIALAARAKGAVGAVVEGAVRDSEALREMRFPVWSRGIYPGHTGKSGPGAVNVPIVIGGVRVEPGDVVVADDDGVIAISPSLLPAVLEKARARAEREIKIRGAISQGKVLFDMLDLQTVLEASHTHEVDMTWKEG
jgi:4-hydroxy-4-methyl-2-oxoglutarate aldolase